MADAKLSFNVENGGIRTNTSATVNYTAGSWHQIVGVFKNSKAIIYFDTKNKNSASGPSNTPSLSNDATLGEDSPGTGWGNNFNGDLAETRVYDHPLTKKEIQYLYEAGQRGRFRSSSKRG